jgi:hypothetical protein
MDMDMDSGVLFGGKEYHNYLNEGSYFLFLDFAVGREVSPSRGFHMLFSRCCLCTFIL